MDKRLYQRIFCHVECILLSANENASPCEIEGVIVDMSESGIKISFDKSNSSSPLPCLNVNDPIHFQAFEEYEVLGEQKEALISGDAIIIRIIDNEDTVEIGCKYTKRCDELDEYIKDRKVSLFLKGMSKNQ